jgi:hypothetical protein
MQCNGNSLPMLSKWVGMVGAGLEPFMTGTIMRDWDNLCQRDDLLQQVVVVACVT